MRTKTHRFQQRLEELEKLAGELQELAEEHFHSDSATGAQPTLAIKGQRWYRGARALLEEYEFSDLGRFDVCFRSSLGWEEYVLLPKYDLHGDYAKRRHFKESFLEARSLLHGAFEELISRELSVVSELSFAVATDEFETASSLFEASEDEPIVRASGVVARVALERHLFTVAEARSIQIQLNPPTKKKADVSDLLVTFVRTRFITATQKSELDWLFSIGNNCAHPKESVKREDVRKLIARGKELAAVIL
jgi:hypothetical protein